MADEVNITPDMIENLISMFKNSNAVNSSDNSSKSSNSNNYSNSNVSDFAQNPANFNASDSAQNSDNFNASDSAQNSSDARSNFSFDFDKLNFGGNFDFDTIMKLKSIIEAFNSNDNRDSQLLYSLKPYLRKSRQDKLDQYINLLKFTQVAKFLK